LAEGSTTRIEAFSDGVFSIASTLLILEIRIPHAGVDGGLWAGLVALWPSYLAFALSFFVILVTWITHHDLMRLVRETTHFVLLANGCALIYVTFIPFPTAVLAANLGGPETSTAVALYCGTFVFGSAAFNLLVAAIARGQLCRPEVDAQAIDRVRRGFRITFVVYLVATGIAFVAPYVALAINIAVRVHLLRIRYRLAASLPTPVSQLTG
jgi:TMEM175 potassium channel family protein